MVSSYDTKKSSDKVPLQAKLFVRNDFELCKWPALRTWTSQIKTGLRRYFYKEHDFQSEPTTKKVTFLQYDSRSINISDEEKVTVWHGKWSLVDNPDEYVLIRWQNIKGDKYEMKLRQSSDS